VASAAVVPVPSVAAVPSVVDVIKVSDVTKRYLLGSVVVEALRGVSMTVAEGQFLTITGPSGSGKSTLMHLLGCLDIPTTGEILISGERVDQMGEIELASLRNRRIGFIFQQFNLLASVDAVANVELGLIYARVPRAERRARSIELLERIGLGNHLRHRPMELSGGQQQRVAIARALVGNPDLILADEPTGNLDSASAQEILTIFDELHATGRTVVVITHDPEVAARGSHTLTLRDGRILAGVA